MSGFAAMIDTALKQDQKGLTLMSQYERRQEIYNALCIRRYDTIANLAAEFHVNEKTIRRDIVWLTRSFPVEASPGRYGGVRIAEWFHPVTSYLCPRQLSVLRKLTLTCSEDDLIAVNSIISQFSPK